MHFGVRGRKKVFAQERWKESWSVVAEARIRRKEGEEGWQTSLTAFSFLARIYGDRNSE
jgi:hypothetical protein